MDIANDSGVIAALDVGDVRIGVATASLASRLAKPNSTINHDQNTWQALRDLIGKEFITEIVIGLPRNMEGDDTAQTRKVRLFADQAQTELKLPVHLQDEALTSVKAEAELQARGSRYNREMIDALAATYILEDYLSTLSKVTEE